MGKLIRGKQDGTGPRQGSYREQNSGMGKRRAADRPCPFEQNSSVRESKPGKRPYFE